MSVRSEERAGLEVSVREDGVRELDLTNENCDNAKVTKVMLVLFRGAREVTWRAGKVNVEPAVGEIEVQVLLQTGGGPSGTEGRTGPGDGERGQGAALLELRDRCGDN